MATRWSHLHKATAGRRNCVYSVASTVYCKTMYLLGEVQEGDVSVVESRLHFPPLSHILYKPHLNQTMIVITMDGMLFFCTYRLPSIDYNVCNIKKTGLYISGSQPFLV